MAYIPPVVPSPQARRQAQIQALQAALASRDAQAIERLLGQWVHRQGVNQVQALHQELAAADPQGWSWWQLQQSQAIPEPVQAPSPVVAVAALPEQAQLPRASASRPAPAPSHPAVVQLRAWLPDREERRAA